MKIGNNIESLQSELVARAANGSRSPVASTAQQVGGVDGVDKVELSETSRRLTADATAGVDGDIRADKVNEVRQAMQEGRFQVSARAVADKMINEAAELIEVISTGRNTPDQATR